MSDGDNAALPFERTLTTSANVTGLPRRALTFATVATGYLVFAACTTGLGAPAMIVAGATCFIGVLGTRRHHLARVAIPFIVFAAFYSELGWLRPAATGRNVEVFFPYWFDKAAFGIGDFADRVSWNEFFADNHGPVVDFITGIAYLSFLPCVLIFAAYLTTQGREAGRARRAQRFGWTFLGVNLAGFGTYVLCPVAPPWYVATQGFGPVNPATHASAAALGRWDAMMGIPYFERFYSQATEVFGALPSMHCAYPMLLVLFSWELGRIRLMIALLFYQLLMCFSAVYLQHHYVTDAIAGMLYAVVTYALGRLVVSCPPLTKRARERTRGEVRAGSADQRSRLIRDS